MRAVKWVRRLGLDFAIAAVASAAILGGGLWLYRVERRQVQTEAASRLAAIGRLKADSIATWRSERIADASSLTESPLSADALRAALHAGAADAALAAHLRVAHHTEGCADILLTDAEGEPVASAAGVAGMGVEARHAVRSALHERLPVLTDLYLDPRLGAVRLDAVAPLFDPHTGVPLGAVVFANQADSFLYPMIRSWPTPSASGESLLVRRDGDSALYLNDLRHREGTALRLRIPLANREVPAVKAVLGLRGITEGIDYRGAQVLSFITEVSGSPWLLVAKVDTAEAFSAMTVRGLFVLALVAAGLVTVGGGVAWARQRAQKEDFRRAYEAEARERALLSEHQRAADALAASEDRLRRIIDGAAEGFVVVQGERIVMANPRALALFEASAEEVAAAHYLDYTWPEDRPLIADRTRARFAGEKVSGTVTYRLRTSSGKPIPVEAHSTLIQWDGAAASLIFLTDLTERVQAEEERARLQDSLQQSRRPEAIGLLAGGVAHDFNTMLAAILGYAELARDDLPADSPTRADLDEIVKAAGRSRDLVRQLLAFARRQTLQLVPLDLNVLITGLQPLLRRTLREDVRIRLRLASSLPAIQGDKGQISQVLLNLAVNAQDAMPGGGELLIETGEEVLDDDYASNHAGVLQGRYVVMSVSDTGSGMNAETLQRLFEPFFTTKGPGKGTGLGLPTVYGIMKQHRGTISVSSQPGRGSIFRACFPAAGEAAAAEAPAEHRRPARGAETVLVVEDQEQTRALVCEMLKRSGYHVLEAADGESALAAAASHGDGIDIMVTDVVMTGMNGWQLAERLRQMSPRTRVLFMSGHASDIIGDHGVLEPNVEFIQKPFSLADFTAKVRAVLDRLGG